MISVDTNVIVRLLTGDDQEQFHRAKSLFGNENILIATTVILECEWVLRYAYRFSPDEIVNGFQALFGLSNVKLQETSGVYNAIQWHKQGMDFADAIHLATSQDGSESFATFDKKFIESALEITDLSVIEP
jgi:predicted nucleic-acid-binding protein